MNVFYFIFLKSNLVLILTKNYSGWFVPSCRRNLETVMKLIESKKIIYPFIFLTSFGVYLYIGYFSWFLLNIGTSPLQVSILIGITSLSSIFWGPLAGKIIDYSNKKKLWLAVGQILTAITVILFGYTSKFEVILTSALVVFFSLLLNLNAIIVNQYIIPLLADDYEHSVALESRVSGFAILLSSLLLAFFYDYKWTFIFYLTSAICFALSAVLILSLNNLNISPVQEICEKKSKEVFRHVYKKSFLLIKENGFLALAMCTIAFTETSFSANFDVIAFTLKTTPYTVIFLFGAVSGIMDSCASWLYPKILKFGSTNFRWYFLLCSFLLVFATAAALSMSNITSNSPLFLPAVVVSLEFIGVWWGIFISARVREASRVNEYGQTMASFRIPRSLITFFGITSIGAALQSGKMEWVFTVNATLLAMVILLKMTRHSEKR